MDDMLIAITMVAADYDRALWCHNRTTKGYRLNQSDAKTVE
jgi:hypothetical protein